MAIVTRERKNGKVVHYVTLRKEGVPVYEGPFTEERQAKRRQTTMKREIASGSYVALHLGGETVGAFAKEWFRTRTNRTATDEESWWRNHVEGRCPWFVKLKLDDVMTVHTDRLATELKKPYTLEEGEAPRTLSPKSHSNVFGVAKTMWGDVMRKYETRIVHNPFKLLKKGTTSTKGKKRLPYTAAEVRTLTTDERLPLDVRVMIALLFYTGMREGEACGRRWRDYDRDTFPLGALSVGSQYKDLKLKTDDDQHDASREIPVHPDLARILDAWRAEGFELTHCRRPTPDDFIVPARWAHGHNQHMEATPAERRGSTNHTRSSCYKMFRRACGAVGVANRSLHSTRHTFITLTRRDTNREDILETITHNAKGEMIDRYNHFHWDVRCEVVACFLKSSPTPPPVTVPVPANVRQLPVKARRTA